MDSKEAMQTVSSTSQPKSKEINDITGSQNIPKLSRK
jgi:hypothetical protein